MKSTTLMIAAFSCMIAAALRADESVADEAQTWWSLRPVVAPAAPGCNDTGINPIDRFLSAEREARGLMTVGPADRLTLLRRVYLDLVGLPPSIAQQDAFLADTSPDAYEKIVDQLLESEQHAVRYARHWLDVLRYADQDLGMTAAPGIHLWRDWVINALHEDLPYDDFVQIQLTGRRANERTQISNIGYRREVEPRPGDLFAWGVLARGSGDGYLGASVAATPFQAGETPIPNLHPPKTGSTAQRDRQMRLLHTMNEDFRRTYASNSDIQARLKAYELAASMQMSAPEAVDFSQEPEYVKSLYGIDEDATRPFGEQLLLARRLAERGVRFIQICHAGGGNGGWDSHGDMQTHAPLCRATDKPIAGLIKDLKQRGMLDETLVVWTSEFGRTPWSQNTTGRDHNSKGYTSWMAGGGIKGGIVHGATDDFGYQAVEDPHYCSDLHATILHQLGIDHTKMFVPELGPVSRLVEDSHGPIKEIIG